MLLCPTKESCIYDSESKMTIKGGVSNNFQAIKENNNMMDFEVGQLLQSSIIPKAVLYFTGEMCVDDEDDDDEDVSIVDVNLIYY